MSGAGDRGVCQKSPTYRKAYLPLTCHSHFVLAQMRARYKVVSAALLQRGASNQDAHQDPRKGTSKASRR
jgi:hypothetical protein